MPGEETVLLVGRAKGGDTAAWAELVQRYYDSWLRRYHGDLGSTIHKLYDTQNLVQSAVGDALRDLPDLRSDAAFFSWVTSILRHKVALRRRQLARERTDRQNSVNGVSRAAASESASQPPLAELDDYMHTLEEILALFPEHPEAMAAVSLMFLENLSVAEIVQRMEKSKSSVYRWLESGIHLLRERLTL